MNGSTGREAFGAGLYVGPAGWAYEDWDGIVYPAQRPSGFDPLCYMAEFFDCIEVNSTFYRIPAPHVCESWAKRVAANRRFRFTIKLYRGFTHERSELMKEDAEAFTRGIMPVAEAGKLGCVLMQFPWSFKGSQENRDYLDSLFGMFRGLPLVLEVRHASWNAARFHGFLRDHGVGLCNIDQPVFRGSMKPSARSTSGIGYFRLHGRNYDDWFTEGAGRDARYDYLYSMEELSGWIERIAEVKRDVPAVYVIMNNHFKGKAACNALQLRARLEGGLVHVPPPLAAAYPQLGEIAG